MARGNNIVVTADPRGVFTEGILAVSQTVKPGMIVQRDPSVALVSGRHTYKIYSRVADGDRTAGALWVVLNDYLQGMPTTGTNATFAAGSRLFLYSPIAGEELNVLLADVAGTADDHALGELLEVKNTVGKLIAATGSPQSTPFMLLETITDPVADTLAWVSVGGV